MRSFYTRLSNLLLIVMTTMSTNVSGWSVYLTVRQIISPEGATFRKPALLCICLRILSTVLCGNVDGVSLCSDCRERYRLLHRQYVAVYIHLVCMNTFDWSNSQLLTAWFYTLDIDLNMANVCICFVSWTS